MNEAVLEKKLNLQVLVAEKMCGVAFFIGQ